MIVRFKTNWKRIHWPKIVAGYLVAFLSGSAVYSLLGAIAFCTVLSIIIILTLLLHK